MTWMAGRAEALRRREWVAGTTAEWMSDHPEWWSLLLCVGAWVVLLFHDSASGALALCLAPSANAASGFADRLRTAWATGALGGMLLTWGVMTLAMMPPLMVPLIRHVAVRSFTVRRSRAVAEFLLGVLGAWWLIGAAIVPMLAGVPRSFLERPLFATTGFIVAALWQLAPAKRLALLRCHRTFPLAPFGWRADRDCIGYGFAHGRDCVVSCWAMMLAMALAPHGLAAMLSVQSIAISERLGRRPRPRASALVLTACAGLMLA